MGLSGCYVFLGIVVSVKSVQISVVCVIAVCTISRINHCVWSMGDSETVVAQSQTASMVGYAPVGYASAGYADGSSNVVSEATGEISNSAAPADATFLSPDFSNVGDGIADTSLVQESHVGTGNEAVESSQTAGYDSSANGPAVVGSVENGSVSENAGGAVDEQQYVDGSGMSSWACCVAIFSL